MNKDSLEALFDNEVPAIRVANFCTPAEAERLVRVVKTKGFDFYEDVVPPIGRIGITQFEHSNKSKDEYLGMVERSSRSRDAIFQQAAFNPLLRVKRVLGQTLNCPVGFAQEPMHGEYFAGLIRQIDNSAKKHFDFAPYDAKGWAIEQVTKQVAWNIYLEMPDQGGETVVYNQPWLPDKFERFLLEGHSGSYGFSDACVEGAQAIVIKPRVCDLWLFNTRNFHEVLGSSGPRITVSSFVGQTAPREYVMWS